MRKSAFLLLNICIAMLSCKDHMSTTPKQYKNKVKISKDLYFKDSLEITNVLRKMLKAHLNPFNPDEEFDSSTKIFVDSILYNKGELNMVVLVITKNNTNKLLKKENNEIHFYNGNYLFCSRENKKSPIKIYDYAGFNLVHFYSYNDIKKRLQEYCFEDLGNEKGKYNIDDIRIWKSDYFRSLIKYSHSVQIQ